MGRKDTNVLRVQKTAGFVFGKPLSTIPARLGLAARFFSYPLLHSSLEMLFLSFYMDELYSIIMVTPLYLQNIKVNLLELGMCLLQVAASMQKDVEAHVPSYPNLPSKLICLLHSVTLQVN